MKSAEEAMETLKLIKFHLKNDNPGEALEAITAYAEERVKEAHEESGPHCQCLSEDIEKDRAKALDACKKLITERWRGPSVDTILSEIDALKAFEKENQC